MQGRSGRWLPRPAPSPSPWAPTPGLAQPNLPRLPTGIRKRLQDNTGGADKGSGVVHVSILDVDLVFVLVLLPLSEDGGGKLQLVAGRRELEVVVRRVGGDVLLHLVVVVRLCYHLLFLTGGSTAPVLPPVRKRNIHQQYNNPG